MVPVSGGVYTIGGGVQPMVAQSPTPKYDVAVSPFHIDAREVTIKEFSDLCGYNPSTYSLATQPNFPVNKASYLDAAIYLNARSKRDHLDTVYSYVATSTVGPGGRPEYVLERFRFLEGARGYRLPTETEWEIACRAGTTTKYFWGDSYAQYGTYANINQTLAVGLLFPNNWGLYDMIGNVAEICRDVFARPSVFDSFPQICRDAGVTVNPCGSRTEVDSAMFHWTVMPFRGAVSIATSKIADWSTPAARQSYAFVFAGSQMGFRAVLPAK
jgi:formylglycine-generating enzyme required for sulfatase activity